MTIEEAEARVEKIRKIALEEDDEQAHASEDALHQLTLEAIANDPEATDHIRALANVALSTSNIDFSRWCA